MEFPKLDEALRLERLTPPTGKVRIVLDTDTYNEIDDQFAVVQALLSPDQLAVEAIYAVPFYNSRSSGPGDGMEKSYEEILRLLERLDISPKGLVFRGATDVLRDGAPQESAAVDDLIAKGPNRRPALRGGHRRAHQRGLGYAARSCHNRADRRGLARRPRSLLADH